MKVVTFLEPSQAAVIEKILRDCGLWQSSTPKTPPEADGLVLELRDRPVFCGLIGRSFTLHRQKPASGKEPEWYHSGSFPLAFAILPCRLRPVSENQISYQSPRSLPAVGLEIKTNERGVVDLNDAER